MNPRDLLRLFPDTARINERGHLEIGGCDTVALAREYGTPLYVFCEETLRARCRAFRTAFTARHPDTLVLYAGKAYLGPALARLVQEEGLGLDAVSGGELAVARAVSFPPSRIYLHGNNKSEAELREALNYGVARIVVDNLYELDLLERLARELGVRQPVLIRVNPGVDPHTHAYTTTGVLDSKFGLPLATGQARQAVVRALRSPHLDLQGLHFHLGSPIFETEPYRVAMERVLAFAGEMRGEGLDLRELSPGGGFAVAYLPEDEPPTPDAYAEAIVGALREGCQRHALPLPRLVVEPGRAIVGPAGVALYTVGAVKAIPGVRTFVAVDGGMGDNIRPALYGARYSALCASRADASPQGPVTLVGRYCESGDVLVRDWPMPPLEPGDLVALACAGAYAPAMASNYNLNPRPAILFVRGGQARLVRRRETYADLLACDLP